MSNDTTLYYISCFLYLYRLNSSNKLTMDCIFFIDRKRKTLYNN